MGLDWDILLDDVSIKDQIASFEVRDSEGAYAKELTINAANQDFYDQFDFDVLPQLRLEVKVKETDTWVSLGMFYIEQPGIAAGPDEISGQGMWGRSESAKAGPPFAPKMSQSWSSDTTANAIMDEAAALADVTLNFEMTDYSIFAGTYAVEDSYPIDVIVELAGYAGGVVGCNSDGELVVRSKTFFPSSADHTITDSDITGLSETVEYPEFGNRIKISADGSDSSIAVNLEVDNNECLPADGSSTAKLYAFVTDSNGEPVNDGVIVTWEAESGVTLSRETSATGDVLITNKVHNADSYHKVTVDYPISSVVGIWAYSDRQHENNFWSDRYCTFEDNEITVFTPFDYCDQTLVITYVAAGCATNTVTAGSTAVDATVTASVEGTEDSIEIKIGNVCSCGSSLDAIKNTDSDICFGNSAPVLIWAELSGGPATGMIASMTLTGCGELSSTKKILGSVNVTNEVDYVINEIQGTSQVEAAIYISEGSTPEVYLITDENKTTDLYSSHDGKTIDLNTEVATGTEVWIDYTADGAATVYWLGDDVEEECEAEILIKIADGTERGLSETVSIRTSDCSEDDPSESDPLYSDYSSDDDPDDFDNDGTDGGDTTLSRCIARCAGSVDYDRCVGTCNGDYYAGAVILEACDVMVLNAMAKIENATSETIDNIRFGVDSSVDCSLDDPWGCPCSDLCESEIRSKGNTYKYNKTIHETVIETYAEGTPEYYEEYASLRAANLAECESDCDSARAKACECPGGDLEIDTESSAETVEPSGSCVVVFSGGFAPYSVSISGTGFWLDAGYTTTSTDTHTSTTVTIYTDGDACGSCAISISDGCSDIQYAVMATEGQWVQIDSGADVISEFKGSGAELLSGDNYVYYTHSYQGATGSFRVIQEIHAVGVGGSSWNGSEAQVCSRCDSYTPVCTGSYVEGTGWDVDGCLSYTFGDELLPEHETRQYQVCDENDCGACTGYIDPTDCGPYGCASGSTNYQKRYGVPVIQEWQC